MSAPPDLHGGDKAVLALAPAGRLPHPSTEDRDVPAMRLARCVTDHRLTICDVDDMFAEILQQSPSRLRGSSIYDLTHPDDLPANRRLLDRLRSEGKGFAITKRYLRESGDVIWVKNHVSRLPGSGASAKLLATIQPIDPPRSAASGDLANIAEKILEVRRARLAIFRDDIFGEPGYEVLLDLFVNEQRGRSVSVSSACIAASVPSTTALRHIAGLVSLGWVERVADIHDRRRTNLALTSAGCARVVRYLEECERARQSL